MKYYYADNGGYWFVCLVENKKKAKTLAVEEFGRGNTSSVRPATDKEVAEYERWRGCKVEPY